MTVGLSMMMSVAWDMNLISYRIQLQGLGCANVRNCHTLHFFWIYHFFHEFL